MDYGNLWKYRCVLFPEWAKLSMQDPTYAEKTTELICEAQRCGLCIDGEFNRNERTATVGLEEMQWCLNNPRERDQQIQRWTQRNWIERCPPCYAPEQANG